MQINREELINIRSHNKDLNNDEIAVQSLDCNGVVINVSPGWLQITGYDKDEVIGLHFWEFLGAESLLQAGDKFPKLKDFGYVDDVPLQIKCKDNSYIDISLTGTSKYKNNGDFERTFCELTPSDIK